MCANGRHLFCLVLLLAFARSATAQTADLSEAPLADQFFRVELTMKLAGKTKVQQEVKPVNGGPIAVEFVDRPIVAEAQHKFHEKILAVSDGIVDRTVRVYVEAWALTKQPSNIVERTFRNDRTFLVTQRVNGQNVTYCPRGSLTQQELELTDHFNTMAVTGLLPGKMVKVGETWPVPKNVVQALLSLEGLIGHDFICMLEEVKGDFAKVSVAGTAKGIDGGANVKTLVQAHFRFDVTEKRLVSLTWKQTDQRDQGPISPPVSAEVDITLKRTAIAEPAYLSKVIINAMVPPGDRAPPALTQMLFKDPQKRFEVQYAREWVITAQAPEHTVWRLMDRGDLVAQATVIPWKKFAAGQMVPFKDFTDAIDQTPGWEEAKKIDEQKNIVVPGNRAYRYAASGKLDGVEVVQFYYLLAGARGDHMFVTFTMNPNQVKTLDVRDMNFVRGISFPAPGDPANVNAGASDPDLGPPISALPNKKEY